MNTDTLLTINYDKIYDYMYKKPTNVLTAEEVNDYFSRLDIPVKEALYKNLVRDRQAEDQTYVEKVLNYPKTMLAIATLGAVCAGVFSAVRRDAPESTDD